MTRGRRNKHLIIDGVEHKQCNGCKRFLPANSGYFWKDACVWDGFQYKCRECMGSNFIDYVPKLTPRDGFKFCNKCGEEKPNTNEYFYKSKYYTDGLSTTCKICATEYRQQYNAEHKEQNIERAKLYRQAHREQHRLYNYEYYKKHPMSEEKKRELYKRRKAYVKIYDQTHKEEMRIRNQKRRAKKKQLPSSLTKKQWLEIKERFDNKCCYCGEEKTLTQDHFIPFVNGGEYTLNNILPACAWCNYSKGGRDFFDWYPKQEFYDKKREKALLKFLGYKGRIQQLALM